MEEVESWQQDPNVSLLKPNYFLSAVLASVPVFARPSLLALNLLTGEFPGTKEAQGGDEAPVATALTKRSRPGTRSPAQPPMGHRQLAVLRVTFPASAGSAMEPAGSEEAGASSHHRDEQPCSAEESAVPSTPFSISVASVLNLCPAAK